MRKRLYTDALNVFNNAKDLDKTNFSAYYWAGACLLALDQLDDATEHSTIAHTLNPQSAAINHLLGIILLQKRNYAAALSYLEKAMELDPDNLTIRNTLKKAQMESSTHYQNDSVG